MTRWNDSARQVLAQVRYAGMRWHVRAGRLYLTGATEALTDAHRAAINQHRPQLVAILEALPVRCVVPHVCCVIGACNSSNCQQARQQQEGRDVA